jgi:hypothetical protein
MSYEAEVKTLGQLLSGAATPIVVPAWQRNFAWKSTEIETFWTDLMGFVGETENEELGTRKYFLGSIVLVGEDGSPEYTLLDGQQRLATSTIVLGALRERLASFDAGLAEAIASEFIISKDLFASQSPRPRLTLNRYDEDYFRVYVQEFPRPTGTMEPKPQIASHHLITKAYDLALTRTREATSGMNDVDTVAWIRRVAGTLTLGFSVVAVSSRDEDTAAEVFETLNDRGIGLSTPDLLRNYLMRRAPHGDRKKVEEDWGHLLKIEEDVRVDLFLRHYWITRVGDVKKHSLYKEIKNYLKGQDAAESAPFAKTLRTNAEQYQDIATARAPDNDTERLLAGMQLLDAKPIMPALLSAWSIGDDWKPRRKLLKNLIAFFVRHRVIAGLENNQFEKVVFELAKDLRASQDFDAANQALGAAPPTDDDFEERFKTVVVPRRNNARYLLIELEQDKTLKGKTVERPDRVHVEHIYPQTPEAGVAQPDHDAIIERLGNLTLLERPLNQSLRNASFADKRDSPDGYPKSEFALVKELTKPPFDKVQLWTLSEIDARQALLAARARTIWALEI